MRDVPSPEDALALLADPSARDILIATHSQPLTASTLADELDAPPSTVYDRIDDLVEAVLPETTRTDGRGTTTPSIAPASSG